MIPITHKVTNRVLEILARHERPWRVEYRPDPNCGQPRNVRTGGLYRGVNPILLNCAAQRNGLLSCWWGTKRDWRSVGATVRESSLGASVCVYRPNMTLKDLTEELVFNAEHVQGAERYMPVVTEAHSWVDLEPEFVGAVIKGTKADIRVGVGDENNPPSYCGYIYPYPFSAWPNHRLGDYILVPRCAPFGGVQVHEFFCNCLHELIHWSEIRTNFCDRHSCNELVADMGTFLLAQECGIPSDEAVFHYQKWRGDWIKWLNFHDSFIFRFAAQARRATDYVLSRSQPPRNNSHYHDCDPIKILPYYPTKFE